MAAPFARQSLNAHAATPIDRRAERVHLFLVATLYSGKASNPVRVRNLSATGALVEGASLPEAGATIMLRRGTLEAPGTTIWSGSGKAGLAFSGLVDVSEWLPAKEAKRQTQVDQIAFGLKHAREAAVAAPTVYESPMAAMVVELAGVQAQLGQLGDQLGRDASVVAKYPDVRLLDAATQRIGRIVAALRSATPG